ncbi:phage tail tip fiber protein [Phytobacter diazotrophicus]|uniref:phage tail tip fiber protein n=1 Tax=Phytobacter diazotrophicus TaxID=395631 RepID=UPI003B5860AF
MGSGGGGGSTPKLINDNLKSKQFLRVLDLISEGPIYGPVDQNHLSSFMLNKTPVTDAAGNVTINGVSVAWRPGTATQTPINGFNAIEATTVVNTDVTQSTPLVRTVTDTDVDRVRMNIGVSGLVQQDTKGNQHETSVTMVIETRVGNGAWQAQKTVTISGKISGEYLEAHLFDAPDTKPFDIRLRRITEDSSSDLLSNGTVWNSFTEITDDNLSYPYAAVAGCVVDRDQYTDTPTRTYHLRGLIVDVPDNYDPVARAYAGIWTGGFKSSWTNNPAWIFRALVKNSRYGLAKRAGYVDVDDGSLYVLSQFCDQLVDDGYGGQEPRFTLNAYITEQKSARDLLDDIAGMFRGIALWDGMRFSVMLDNPQDPVASITNANVVDGVFTYSSMKRSERYNAVVVSWTDPNNGWEQVKEYVSDDEMIDRYGYNETTMEAFGCTSRGQAFRTGKWMLETARRETKKVTFKMAREAIRFLPGDIVEVMDNNYAATRLGGRIMSHAGATIIVDADISELAGGGDSMSLMGSNGKFAKYEIDSVDGRLVTLKNAPVWVREGTVFVVTTGQVAPRLFRIMGISEDDNNSVYSISATLHDPNKQAIVDEGAVFEIPNDTLNGYRVPNVENLRIINTNSETVQVTATWETATTTKKLVFELYVYAANGAVVAQFETEQFRYEFYGLNAGSYTLGVRGRNENGMKGAETQVSLIIGAPMAPNSVQWIPGPLQATLVPVMSVTATTDTSFEYWYAGETPIPLTNDIEDNTQFLGRGNQWTIQNLKFDHTYYVYVRTRNAFGVSAFVEASGKPTEDFSDITDAILDEIKDSALFKDIIENAVETSKTVADLATAITQNADQLAAAVGANRQTAEAIIGNALAIADVVVRQSAQNGANSATFTQLREVIATETQARVTDVTRLEAKTDQNEAQVTQLTQALSDETQARATAVDTLTAQTEDNTADVTQLTQAVSTLDSSTASRFDELSGKTANAAGGVQNTAVALIQETLAQVNTRMTLSAQYGANSAGIQRVDNVMVDASKAVAESLKTLDATAGGNANITDFAKTMSDFTQTSATKINSLSVTVNGQAAAITTNAQAVADINGNLNAMYSIKVGVDVNGVQYAAGMGLGVQNTPSGMQSQFIVLADRFAVMSQAGTAVTLPFVIQNGQTFIRDTFIQDGTITNAKIGAYIQSNNYVAGSVGWRIGKDGSSEFSNVTVRGTVYATNGEFTGKITATSGTFKGTVQADSFIGDVANAQVFADGVEDSFSQRTFTYSDSDPGAREKHITIMAMISLRNVQTNPSDTAVANVTLAIGSSTKTFSIATTKSADTMVTVMHSARITANTISCSIQSRVPVGATYGLTRVHTPTMMVARGSGAFVQTN